MRLGDARTNCQLAGDLGIRQTAPAAYWISSGYPAVVCLIACPASLLALLRFPAATLLTAPLPISFQPLASIHRGREHGAIRAAVPQACVPIVIGA
jgi:hypothetical protein